MTTTTHTIPFTVAQSAALHSLAFSERFAKFRDLKGARDWMDAAKRLASLTPALTTSIGTRFARSQGVLDALSADDDAVAEMERWIDMGRRDLAYVVYCPDNEDLIRGLCSRCDFEAAHLIAALTGGPIGLVRYYLEESGFDASQIQDKVAYYMDNLPEDLRGKAQILWDECGGFIAK